VLLLARSLGAKLVAKGRESDPKDTPLVSHEQAFVFLSTSQCTDLKRNAVRPEIVSMGQERVEAQHIGTAASGRGALAHHRQENDENRLHHGDVIRPDVKKDFRFGPLRRGKFIFRLIKHPPYYRVDSVEASNTEIQQFQRWMCSTLADRANTSPCSRNTELCVRSIAELTKRSGSRLLFLSAPGLLGCV
jgi:hypothetical protein